MQKGFRDCIKIEETPGQSRLRGSVLYRMTIHARRDLIRQSNEDFEQSFSIII